MTLKEALKDWTDPDVAQFWLGACLGLWPETADPMAPPLKAVFWSRNELGDTLVMLLSVLTEAGVLEADEDTMQGRWNPSFGRRAVDAATGAGVNPETLP